MGWSNVGSWLKQNGKGLTGLVGSMLTGNVAGAVASGVSLIAGATGTDDPLKALNRLQSDPQTLIKLEELANQEQASIREHIQEIERIKLQGFLSGQETIRTGDTAQDQYVRMTRPRMARQSWFATIAYCLGSAVALYNQVDLFQFEIALILSTPAWAYLGLRTIDKFGVELNTPTLFKKKP